MTSRRDALPTARPSTDLISDLVRSFEVVFERADSVPESATANCATAAVLQPVIERVLAERAGREQQEIDTWKPAGKVALEIARQAHERMVFGAARDIGPPAFSEEAGSTGDLDLALRPRGIQADAVQPVRKDSHA